MPLKVTSRSGSLMQAVLGGIGGIRTVDFTSNGAVMTYGIGSPQRSYALLLHEGGVRQVTERMRRFFWKKFLTTRRGSEENIMWSRLRYSTKITYKPRPFLENAIKDILPQIPEILRKNVLEGLRVSVKKIIAESK